MAFVRCSDCYRRKNLFQFEMTKNKRKSLWRTHEHFSRGKRCLHCAWHFRSYGTRKGCLFIQATQPKLLLSGKRESGALPAQEHISCAIGVKFGGKPAPAGAGVAQACAGRRKCSMSCCLNPLIVAGAAAQVRFFRSTKNKFELNLNLNFTLNFDFEFYLNSIFLRKYSVLQLSQMKSCVK